MGNLELILYYHGVKLLVNTISPLGVCLSRLGDIVNLSNLNFEKNFHCL